MFTLQPTELKLTSWLKIILVAVLGLVLLVGAAYAGYWYGTQKDWQSQETITKPIKRTSDNGGWTVYRNERYSFSLKYPNNFMISPQSEESIVS